MTLGNTRILLHGDTPYAWEREGIEFVERELPNSDPYHVWELVQLLDPSSGRFYEIDLLVLGFSALYLIEIKSGPGRYKGDSQDWYREVPGERTHYMDPPLRLTDHKCKVLKGLLSRRMPDRLECPRIVPLVFLSHADVQVDLRADGRLGVVTRKEVKEAITHHRFYGAPPEWRGERIDARRMKAVIEAAKSVGLRARKGRELVGSYELGEVLDEGPGYQDRLAVHQSITGLRRRARVYLVPQQTSVERRQQLKRAADREANVLLDVRGNPYILGCADYVTDAERGPTVLFEDFEGAQSLDAFLRTNASLSFDDRLSIVAQLSRAISYCHKRGVVHGAVSPSSVLVRRSPEHGKVEIRLFNFQLSNSERSSGTVHWSQLADETAAVYQAPELREDPSARNEPADIFGLGAVAYLVFTGEAPGKTALEVDARLRKEHWLDPRAVDGSLADAIVSAIEIATLHSPAQRADSAAEWFELLEGELTCPADPAGPAVSPLEAGPEAVLDGDLLVERVPGHGASSRVLAVLRADDPKRYALKVSLSEEHDERLRAEARALGKLRDQRIVALIEQRVISDRVCLLLEIAGERTLHQELTREGPMSLDYAARYGEDLLSALETVEKQNLMHRDIKPANLGVGAVGKEAKHLTLFDFSLAEAPLSELGVGTAAYRDPFLRDRKAWDHAADRYSAAVTLHEMLTGVRPSWGDGGPALDEHAELTLAAERFDAAARDGLVKFFRQALARDVEQRFASARDMRRAWERALEEPRRAPSTRPEAPSTLVEPRALNQDDVRPLVAGTPVEALPLSTRAKSALDRAGIGRVDQLRTLADNRLSAVRGIGTTVSQEILAFRELWQKVHGKGGDDPPFFAGYRGDDVSLDAAALEPHVTVALRDAGCAGFAALAAAPREQLLAVAKRKGFELAPLRALLEAEQAKVDEREHPSSLEGWLAALLPKNGKAQQYLDALLGLTAPFEGQLDVVATQVAKHFGVTAPNLYVLLGNQRGKWAEHPAADELVSLVTAIVREQGGATSIERAADLVRSRLAHHDAAPVPLQRARAAALLRIAGELERAREGELCYLRLHDREPWLFEHEPEASSVAQLGVAADALSAREVLASPAEAARHFALAVEGTALEGLTPARLIELACAASKRAACSARLEVYPRGMAAERALELTANVLKGGAKPEEVSERVRERYPLASALPMRPALDGLMQIIGFEWRELEQVYARHGEAARTSLGTQMNAFYSRFTTAPTGQPRQQSAAALTARDFDQRLRAAVEDQSVRVLGVSIDAGQHAARLLAQAFGTPAISFDELFLAELEALTAAGKPGIELVKRTDGAGPGSAGWNNLRTLAEECAKRMVTKLVPAKAPLLLHQLGLIARYELSDFLRALVQGAQSRDSHAVFLLVPCPDSGGIPRINGSLSIPGLLPGQALWLPPEWLKNTHNAAA